MNDQQLWTELEHRLGWPVPDQAREFLRLTLQVESWRRGDPQALVRIETVLRYLQQSGLITRQEVLPLAEDEDPPAPAGKRDQRWALWRDLRRRSGNPGDAWRALRVALVIDATNQVMSNSRVELSFDGRLSQGALIGEIRRLWPRLRAAHWIRDTRVIEARAEALLRFVCLEEQPNTPWHEMMQRWNARYPHWQHKHVRDFRSRFARYEEQLTGRKYGLEWFYNTDARAWRDALGDLTVDDLEDAEAQGKMTPAMRAAVRDLWPLVAQSGYALSQLRTDRPIGPVRMDHGAAEEDS